MTIAVTGHRPQRIGGFTNDAHLRRVELAHDILHLHKPSRVIQGMALGWDQAVAYAAMTLQIPQTAAVPFEEQEKAWPEQAQATYHHYLRTILAQGGEVVAVSSGGYSPAKLFARNRWMVDQLSPEKGDFLLALWDGEERGGTWECVKYARERGVKVENCWEEWERLMCR